MDRNEFKNYRPIANLPFIAKTLERIVAAQLRTHLEDNGLYPVMQSAYRQFHSTETALLKVANDLLLAIDKGLKAIIILLDFSSAFDTIDHSMMIQRFCNKYVFEGAVLQWLASYLENRSQVIVLNGVQSEAFPLTWGVPQGFVVGPLDFILYSGPLSDVIRSHQGVQHNDVCRRHTNVSDTEAK